MSCVGLKSKGLQMILWKTQGECQVVCSISAMVYYKCSLSETLSGAYWVGEAQKGEEICG